MVSEGLNNVRVRAGDIPDIGSIPSSNSHKPIVRGEAAATNIFIGYLEFGHNYSRIRVLDCEDFLMA